MRASRRMVLKGGALAGAAAVLPLASGRGEASVVVYDSRIAASRLFARGAGIDLAQGIPAVRRALRRLPPGVRVEGLTRWSDWVGLRGMLQERGYRTTLEARDGAGAAMFRWAMRPR